ncbi:hypothetical protein F8C67_02265 [Phaeocystidibacter luteus]|uniref:Uncharacterized protein n=1 Tax=Phaeocystidibacter luteus TaxID=911197 RepID=A0A6N6RM01_9FLAO|nr:hypothetical protein F8C67_02265 [Phaeocystidibacter luteus]
MAIPLSTDQLTYLIQSISHYREKLLFNIQECPETSKLSAENLCIGEELKEVFQRELDRRMLSQNDQPNDCATPAKRMQND